LMRVELMTFLLPTRCSATELQRHYNLLQWARQDSNLRSVTAVDLQSTPFAARDTRPSIAFTKALSFAITKLLAKTGT
jgi:hypothetical protein